MTDAVGYIWSTVTILCTFISLWLCIASIKMIKNANLVKKKGSKFIADELVGRAFMFGSITCAVDFLVCVNIFGAYMYPETGYLNYVPYITWYLFSSAGLAGLLILGSTRDVLPYLPVWLQPFSTLVQSQIRRIIQVGQEDLAVISPKIPVVFSVPVSPYPANFQSRPTNPEDGDRQDSVLLTMKLPRPDITE